MARIVTIIGTRPEIIKMAPVVKALDRLKHEHILVHSGQHYDLIMDEIFFMEMGLRDPDFKFEIKNLPPHLQIASTIENVSKEVADASIVVVQGDTNTTVAGAIAANKTNAPLGHVEAGIRSFDKTMPEEVNRIITDQLSSLLFSPTAIAKENLKSENINAGVHVVGNSVVDALMDNIKIAEQKSKALETFALEPESYFLVTFHRAENADNKTKLRQVLLALSTVAKKHDVTVLFPMHPRTRKRIREFGLEKVAAGRGLKVVNPVGYFDMLALEKNASLILTDSGGLQEEACILKVPCVTLRENTERPETIEIGCNVLAGTEKRRIERAVSSQVRRAIRWRNPYGDGTTGLQIARLVDNFLRRRGRA